MEAQVSNGSDFPSEAMLWIKEVEMVDSLDELKSSRSAIGKDFPNFEMLDAKIASDLKKIIQNSQFKKKVSLEEQKAQKEDRFLRGRKNRLHDLRLLPSDWCRKVARERNARTEIRIAPKTSHQSNGCVEAVHGHIQGLARCYQTQIQTNTGTQLSAISPSIPFAIRYAGFVFSRFTVRPDGRTPFQYLLGTPHVSPLCMCGESVFALIPDHEVRAAKLTNRWISGCW